MASIEKRQMKKGTAYAIVFYKDRKKHKVYFGRRYKLKEVQSAKVALESYLDAYATGEEPSRAAKAYFENAPPALQKRFAVIGIAARQVTLPLSEAWDEFVRDRRIEKEKTVYSYKNTYEWLERTVGRNTPIDQVDKATAERVQRVFVESLAAITASLHIVKIAAFWNWAVDKGYATSNPFKELKKLKVPPNKKLLYVDHETIDAVLDVCPTQEWRALIALWRYGGLRRNEPFGLAKGEIDLERRTLTVFASKTESSSKGGYRTLPIFDRLYKELLPFQGVPPGEIFTSISTHNINRRFGALIKRAGFTPWARAIHNLRASFENDLVAAGFPAHVVADWLGHTTAVQNAHYLQVMSEYFDRARDAKVWDNLGDKNTPVGLKITKKAVKSKP